MTRWAKFPLKCAACDAANESVREAMAKDEKEKKNPGRKLTMGPEDYKWRRIWMEKYAAAAGPNAVSTQKQQRKPGTPVKDCARNGTITDLGQIQVVVRGFNGDLLPKTQVRVIGPVYASGATDGNGTYTTPKMLIGEYRVHAWHKTHSEEIKPAHVVPRAKDIVEFRLKLELPGNIGVLVRDRYRRKIGDVHVTIQPKTDRSGKLGREAKTQKTDKEGETVFTSVRYGTYEVSGKKGSEKTDSKTVKVKQPSPVVPVELKYEPRDIWIGIGGSNSGDLVVLGRYEWNGRVYKLGASERGQVEWADLMSSGWKFGGGLGGGTALIVIFAHGIEKPGQFKQRAKWGKVDYDLSIGPRLAGVLKGVKGISQIVRFMGEYKKLCWAAEQVYKNTDFMKPGVYTIPIPGAGIGLHVWMGRKYGGIELNMSGRGF